MKIILVFILMTNVAYARNWVCTDDIKIVFPSGTETHLGKWIRPGNAYAELIFNIDKVDKLYVLPFIYKNKPDSCEHELIEYMGQSNMVAFDKPFSGKWLAIYRRIPPRRYIKNGKVNFMVVVIKTINNKEITYFKNFTFNINYGEG